MQSWFQGLDYGAFTELLHSMQCKCRNGENWLQDRRDSDFAQSISPIFHHHLPPLIF